MPPHQHQTTLAIGRRFAFFLFGGSWWMAVVFLLFIIGTMVSSVHGNLDDGSGLRCQRFTRQSDADQELCTQFNCYWLSAMEQNGDETGRCYQCSQQASREGCEGTGICIWIEGRDELGGSDCTLCAGRNQTDCEDTGYCFWDVEGFEGVCSKCPGYTDAESCSAGGKISNHGCRDSHYHPSLFFSD